MKFLLALYPAGAYGTAFAANQVLLYKNPAFSWFGARYYTATRFMKKRLRVNMKQHRCFI